MEALGRFELPTCGLGNHSGTMVPRGINDLHVAIVCPRWGKCAWVGLSVKQIVKRKVLPTTCGFRHANAKIFAQADFATRPMCGTNRWNAQRLPYHPKVRKLAERQKRQGGKTLLCLRP